MGIKRFFDKDVIIRRLKTVSGNQKSFQATATVSGAIQEMDAQTRAALEIVESRGWIAYFDIDQDIREGDKLEDEEGTEYTVTEVTQKDYGINQHLEIIMQEVNA